jgi:hypothetical protein
VFDKNPFIAGRNQMVMKILPTTLQNFFSSPKSVSLKNDKLFIAKYGFS